MKSELQKNGNEATMTTAQARSVVRPRVDVFENDAEYLVVADLPGVPKDGIDVRFEDGELRIAGRRAPATSGAPLALEARFADYERVFAMPDGIDAEKISADLASGVLSVRLPKAAARRARRIEVRAS